VVLEKEAADQLDLAYEKWGSVTNCEEGEGYPTNNKMKES
jgi:hypothetical protein